MKYVLYLILAVIAVLVLLLLVAVIRTALMKTKKADYTPNPDPKRTEEYVGKLSEMVQYETISKRGEVNTEKFLGFHKVLEKLFPTVHEKLEKTEIDGNLLFKWKGKSSEKPILIMSHQDVVEATGEWKYPPFSGEVAEGKVWGRGTSDTKCTVMAFFQAVEELLKADYTPDCDVYIASSCTEEIGGDGAPKIVDYLDKQGVRLFLVCDEGGGIIQDPMAGIKGNFAMVGVFEKGYGDVKFIARSTGGHASAPPKNTPIARLSKFVAAVEKKNPFNVEFMPEVEAMFTQLAPYAGFGLRLIFGNLWLFKPLMKKLLPMISAQAGAMLSTTIAFTMAEGSNGYNVIPQEASICANMRYIPHQGTDESLEVITNLAKKFNVETEVVYKGYPSPSVDINGEAFKMVESAINECFPGVGCSPYVVTGATDARFYSKICDSCVRFAPVIYGPEQMKGMHGLNENIECNTLEGAVDFYKKIITMQKR
ncbi:MAG: M20/M25/M40 family metallo-hydrolase [Clostridia bacterium]|nr:M20/M25/M40 family metallo-hydrolase [Clostridia bacterium]